jgi:hypothetical protein
VLPGDPRRGATEAFVSGVFLRSYGARVVQHPALMLVDFDRHGRMRAVAGIRPAAESALFSEIYLEQPVERLLAARFARGVARESIVEVAQLAPQHAGMARPLLAALTRHLAAGGYRWVVFTTVPRLRNAFHRLGLAPQALAPADPCRLPAADRQAWGTYYDHAPWVYAGDIVAGARLLRRGGAPRVAAA